MPKFPTVADLRFYEIRNTPKWAKSVATKSLAKVSIDSVINSHAPSDKPYGSEPHNTYAILASVTRRGALTLEYLLEIYRDPCGTNPEKRRAVVRRILKRVFGVNVRFRNLEEAAS